MTVQQRRQREFLAREQLFIKRAGELVRTEGLLHLQMSKLAEFCEYSTGTLYLHFQSKEDLLVAMAAQSVAKRIDFFQRVADWDGPSRERIVAIALADMLFTRRHPEHFQLVQYVCTEVVWEAASQTRRDEALEAAQPCGRIVSDIVEQGIKAGDVAPHSLKSLEMACGPWSICVGMQTLVQAKGLLDSFAIRRPYNLMLLHVQHLLDGMGWKPLLGTGNQTTHRNLIDRLRAELFPDLADVEEEAVSVVCESK